MAIQRKLTTVFSADVQGYSRLMEADEEGTLAMLKSSRDAMARLIASHSGRVVNTWGDGLIAEFASVVEAVRTAVDVQNELADRNASRSPETRMIYRIGINLGDVIVDGDDIYGDGVNIAARLQSEAPPGGILISNTVYDQVRNKVAVAFDFRGNLSVKNIEESVPSYAVRIGDERIEAPRVQRTAEQAPPPVVADQPQPVFAVVGELSTWRGLATLGVAAAGLVALNLFSGSGSFWAKWPLLVMAVAAAMNWARTNTLVDRRLSILAVAAIAVTAINLMTWGGEFWAKWPLLALALGALMRLIRRDPSRQPPR